MFRNIIPALMVAVVAALLCGGADTAWAHKVNLFAYAEGNTVYTESYFADGTKVQNGTITVTDVAGKVLVTGKTDTKGLFSFPLPGRQTLTISVDASMGHQNSFVLKEEEIPAATAAPQAVATPQAPAPQPDSSPAVAQQSQEKAAPASADNQRIYEELRQIKRELALLHDDLSRPSVRDIMAGLGYIFGLFGVGALVAARRKSKTNGAEP